MNLIDKLLRFKKINIAVIIVCILSLVSLMIFFLYVGWWDMRKTEEIDTDAIISVSSHPELERISTHEEMSPDRQKNIVRYELNEFLQLFGNSYTTYIDNKIIIAVINNLGNVEREYYLFIGEERTGDPHWLGNNYVFFTSYCGTACRGLMLLDVRSGQRWTGVLSYLNVEHGNRKTLFHDWFDKDFEFPGFIKKIHGKFEENIPYLVFDLENEKGVEIGQKRFLFTGYALEEVE